MNPPTGELQLLSVISAEANPACLALDRSESFLLSAYYRAGKVGVHRINSQGALLPKAVHWRSTAAKAHAILVHPDNQWAFVPHTGPNAIYVFSFDAKNGELSPARPPFVRTGAGTGPRHLRFHPQLDCLYFDNEQGSSVSVFDCGRPCPLSLKISIHPTPALIGKSLPTAASFTRRIAATTTLPDSAFLSKPAGSNPLGSFPPKPRRAPWTSAAFPSEFGTTHRPSFGKKKPQTLKKRRQKSHFDSLRFRFSSQYSSLWIRTFTASFTSLPSSCWPALPSPHLPIPQKLQSARCL